MGLIDLERFKNINDSLGRAAGDALLKQVAEWLTRSLGDANLAARMGADHFAVVIPVVEKEESDHCASGKANGIPAGSSVAVERGRRPDCLQVRHSAVIPTTAPMPRRCSGMPKPRSRKAKVTGDRYLFYTKAMTAAVAGKLTLENQLRQAIENEEFVLHYQPKINLASGKLISAEALIRWNDPLRGPGAAGLLHPDPGRNRIDL